MPLLSCSLVSARPFFSPTPQQMNAFIAITLAPPLHSSHHVLCALPSRDVVVDFGKYRGCMLGTLPSRYLRWMTRDMRRGPSSYWAECAEEVLQDPCYQQRLEWEKVERLLKREVTGSMLLLREPHLLSALRSMGWNVDDLAALQKVNVSLLGTTKGGWIPRLPSQEEAAAQNDTRRRKKHVKQKASLDTEEAQPKPLTLREELERRRQLRNARMLEKTSKGSHSQLIFPGRERLLKKVMKERH